VLLTTPAAFAGHRKTPTAPPDAGATASTDDGFFIQVRPPPAAQDAGSPAVPNAGPLAAADAGLPAAAEAGSVTNQDAGVATPPDAGRPTVAAPVPAEPPTFRLGQGWRNFVFGESKEQSQKRVRGKSQNWFCGDNGLANLDVYDTADHSMTRDDRLISEICEVSAADASDLVTADPVFGDVQEVILVYESNVLAEIIPMLKDLDFGAAVTHLTTVLGSPAWNGNLVYSLATPAGHWVRFQSAGVVWSSAGLLVMAEQAPLVEGVPPVLTLTVESAARNQDILKRLRAASQATK
jgi:hypothetical protein